MSSQTNDELIQPVVFCPVSDIHHVDKSKFYDKRK